jgi:predicted nicotinamide N-methyase
VKCSVLKCSCGFLSSGHVQSGQYLWPAAAFMGRYLQDNWDYLKARKVLELGAGVGLAGILASKLPGTEQVVLTDYDHGSLELLTQNIQLNLDIGDSCTTTVEYLEWGKERKVPNASSQASSSGSEKITKTSKISESISCGEMEDAESFSLLLGTDLLYCTDIVRPLFRSAKMLLENSKNSCFVLVSSFDPGQDIEEAVSATCNEIGLVSEEIIKLDASQAICRVEYFRHKNTFLE